MIVDPVSHMAVHAAVPLKAVPQLRKVADGRGLVETVTLSAYQARYLGIQIDGGGEFQGRVDPETLRFVKQITGPGEPVGVRIGKGSPAYLRTVWNKIQRVFRQTAGQGFYFGSQAEQFGEWRVRLVQQAVEPEFQSFEFELERGNFKSF